MENNCSICVGTLCNVLVVMLDAVTSVKSRAYCLSSTIGYRLDAVVKLVKRRLPMWNECQEFDPS